ncbi:hypothetical protein [Bradyrhizobium sp. USDA 313]
MSTPKGKETKRHEQSPSPPGEMLDAEFDELNEADAEFTSWRWPERNEE